jgi:hypothetical protein
MAASTRFLSAVAVAFVAGMASTGAYMSRGDAHRDTPGAPHGATPSLSERLRAEAHGQSLPWSEPVRAKPAPSKLTFTPEPADARAKEGVRVADQGRAPGPQASPVAPPVVRLPDDVGRVRDRLAQSDGQTPSPDGDEADLAPAIKRAHSSEERVAEAPRRARASDAGGRRPVARTAEGTRMVRPSEQGNERPRVSTADASRRIRPSEEEDRPRTKTTQAPLRVRPLGPDEEHPRLRVADAPRRLRASEPEDDGYSRVRTAEAQRPAPRSRPVPSRNLPSLAAADEIRSAVRRAESRRDHGTVAPPYRTASLEGGDDTPRVREAPVVRQDNEPDDEPRVRVHRSVPASDGLMRWLSGPGGRF